MLRIAGYRIDEPFGFAERFRPDSDHLLAHQLLDSDFYFVGQFAAFLRKKLDAIIVIGVMRCTDHDACAGTGLPG